MDIEEQQKLIRQAMEEARLAADSGNSPFGAVLSDADGNIVLSAHNTTNSDTDPTAHAEMNLIKRASNKLGTKDLSSYILICNAQSCPMCFAAAVQAKISNFLFGYAEDETLNPAITVFEMKQFCKDEINIQSGILKDECREQIKKARLNKK